MKIRSFASLEIANYQSLPNYNTAEMRVLGGALVEFAPKGLSPQVDGSVVKLAEQLGLIDGALVERERSTPDSSLGRDGEVDVFSDGAWASLRKGLEYWEAFAAPISAKIPKQASDQAKLATAHEKAGRARVVLERVFGDQGLRFARLRYTEQVVATAAKLQMMKEDGLLEEIEELVGEEIVVALQSGQERYEDMVKARLARRDNTGPSLQELRHELRARMVHYASTILALLDEDEPESFDLLARLQPMVTARRNYSAGLRGAARLLADEGEPEGEAPEPDAVEPGDAAE